MKGGISFMKQEEFQKTLQMIMPRKWGSTQVTLQGPTLKPMKEETTKDLNTISRQDFPARGKTRAKWQLDETLDKIQTRHSMEAGSLTSPDPIARSVTSKAI